MLSIFIIFLINTVAGAVTTPVLRQTGGTTSLYEDFDGDNQADVITATYSAGSCKISSHLSHNKKQTISVSIAGIPASDIGIISRDIDRDQDKDLLVVNNRSHKILHVLINDGKGFFSSNDTFFVAAHNFAPEITQKNRQNSEDNQLSTNQFSLKLLPDTAAFIFSLVSGRIFCANTYCNFSRLAFVYAGESFTVFSPRSPPLL